MNERRIGVFLSYLNIILHTVVGALYVPMLLFYIGKYEYGLYQLIGSFIAYFSIMDFGLTAALIRFYSKYKATDDEIGMENILAIALRAYVCIACFLTICGYLFYINIDNIFVNSLTTYEIKTAREMFLLLLLNVLITISTMIFRAVISANEKYIFLKGLEAVQLLLQPIAVLLFLQRYPGAMTVAIVQTLLNILIIFFQAYYCFGILKINIRLHYLDKSLFHEFRRLALSAFVVTFMAQIFFKTNQIIIGVYWGTVEVAVYSVTSLIYMNYMALSTAISGVYLPYITAIVARNEPIEKLSALFIQIGRWQYYLLSLVASGFIIFGQQFISIWAGKGFEQAYWMTLLIIIPFTIDLIQNIAYSIMKALNVYEFRAKVYFYMGIFNLILAVYLAPKYGGLGCAFATGIVMFLANGVLMNWYYAKVLGLSIKEFWLQIGKISIGVILVTFLGYWFNDIVVTSSIVVYCLKIVVYTIVYGWVLYKCFMNEVEKGKINQVLSKLLMV